jgi:transcriptional regulator GlxA family with amidase domain
LIISELEQALVSSFLFENRNGGAAPWGGAVTLAGGPRASSLASYMEANWDRPLTVEDVAAACGVSARSVFLQFRRTHGMSPMGWLRQLRLEKARRLLMDGEASVISVGLRCGFSSLGHFAQRYRERFGELPSATRSNARGVLVRDSRSVRPGD